MDKSPEQMDAQTARAFLDRHASPDVNLVDVREPWEYEEFHLPGAALIPLADLTDNLKELSASKPTLVYCRSGNRSAAAASLMRGQGFREVHNIVGGIMAWKGDTAVGPWEKGLYHFTGKETPLEILGVAYAMETNLGAFYAALAASSNTPDLQETFDRLARFEEAHQTLLVRLAEKMGASGDIRKALESTGGISAAEGGWAPDDLLKEREVTIDTSRTAVEAAMMFEAQALDLYLRSLHVIQNPECHGLLHELADQETAHLKVLSRFLNRKDPLDSSSILTRS